MKRFAAGAAMFAYSFTFVACAMLLVILPFGALWLIISDPGNPRVVVVGGVWLGLLVIAQALIWADEHFEIIDRLGAELRS